MPPRVGPDTKSGIRVSAWRKGILKPEHDCEGVGREFSGEEVVLVGDENQSSTAATMRLGPIRKSPPDPIPRGLNLGQKLYLPRVRRHCLKHEGTFLGQQPVPSRNSFADPFFRSS